MTFTFVDAFQIIGVFALFLLAMIYFLDIN